MKLKIYLLICFSIFTIGVLNGQWSVIGNFNNKINDLVAFDGKLVIGGDFDSINNLQSIALAYWNGSSFVSDSLYDHSKINKFQIYNGWLYAVGKMGFSMNDTIYLMKSNGNFWIVDASLHVQPNSFPYSYYRSFTSLWIDFNEIWLGTNYGEVYHKVNSDPYTKLYTNFSGVSAFKRLNTINKFNDTIYIGGYFVTSEYLGNSVLLNGFGKWLNSHFGQVIYPSLSIGQANPSVPMAIVNYNNNMYLAGGFKKNDINGLLKWDGINWSDVSGSIKGYFPAIWDMFVDDNKLYVAGKFDSVGNIPAMNIAFWNDTTWNSLGFTSVNDEITAAAFYNNNLYVGTWNQLTMEYKLWCFNCITGIETVEKELITLFPNPALDQLNISFSYLDHFFIELQIFNSMGHMIKDIKRQDFKIEGNKISISTANFSPGIYHIVFSNGNRKTVKKFVKL